MVWKGTSEAAFSGQSSKYFRRPRLGERNQPVEFGTIVEHFEFGNRDPKEAIIEEIRERDLGLMGLHNTFPTFFYKVGDDYFQQPAVVEFNVKK